MMLVKTAHTFTPKAAIARKNLQPGESVCYVTEIEGHKLICLGWQDQTTKIFMATCGTTVPGIPHTRTYLKQNVPIGQKQDKIIQSVDMPKLANQYFNAANAIDVNNHYRANIGIEIAWKTKVWWKRLFGAVLGIITTNAYLAYKYDCERQHVEPMHRDAFVEQVALGLLHIGEYVIDDEDGSDDEEFKSKLRSKKQCVSSADINIEEKQQNNHEVCVIQSLYSHKKYEEFHRANPQTNIRRRCVICHQKAAFYCRSCSTSSNIIAVCGIVSNRPCIATHMSNVQHKH